MKNDAQILIRLPEQSKREIKAKASLAGKSLTDFILESVRMCGDEIALPSRTTETGSDYAHSPHPK